MCRAFTIVFGFYFYLFFLSTVLCRARRDRDRRLFALTMKVHARERIITAAGREGEWRTRRRGRGVFTRPFTGHCASRVRRVRRMESDAKVGHCRRRALADLLTECHSAGTVFVEARVIF